MRICPDSSCNKTARALIACALVIGAVACGKKGPPLPPFPRVPAQVAGTTAARIGEDVYFSFKVPDANVDGHKPADIETVEIYAVTSMGPPETEEQRKVATLLATLPVHPEVPPPSGNESPAVLLPPGLDRGADAVFRETLTAANREVVELPLKLGQVKPVEKPIAAGEEEPEEVPRPLVAPPPEHQAHRYYFAVGVSPRGRKGLPSSPVPVALDAALAGPAAPAIAYTEQSMTLTWTPSAQVRTATLEPPPPIVPPPPVAPPGAAAGNVSANTTPPVPETPVLPAKSLGFNIVATKYLVYEIPKETPAEDPLALKLPVPLTPQPIDKTEFALPGAVVYGVERCFAVRAVDSVDTGTAQGALSPIGCVTPKDTFPPAVPKSLGAIAGAGVINLIWDANTEPDLAGYIVLRGEAPGDTLRAITPTPVKETRYRDETVRPGVRYVYVVVAVDSADPQNVSGQSNRVEETARQ
jgi:hypothetical protein